VTGATGFLGGAVTRRILEDGEPVHVLARDPAAARPLEEAGARVFAGSIADPNDVRAAARGCDVVVHAAGEASHRAAPRALRWINVAGTENVLNGARHAGVRRLVYVSCADATLANLERVHWDEQRGLTFPPLDVHARTKLLAEEIVLAASGLETTALRPAMPWGPGDTTTLPALCREARAGGVRLVGRGKNLVATTYVDHLVDAVLLAAEVEEARGNFYYIADDELIFAEELYGALCEAARLERPRPGPPYAFAYAMAWARERMGKEGPWRTDVIRRGRGSFFNCQKARNELDWEPRVKLADGMQALAAWVERAGGADAVARMGRPPATAGSVDAQAAAAAAAH
jgi:nucleoside-diphosphate-sugar epimerase